VSAVGLTAALANKTGTGIVADPTDGFAHAYAVMRLLDDKQLYQSIVESGLRLAAEYSFDTERAELIRLYRAIGVEPLVTGERGPAS